MAINIARSPQYKSKQGVPRGIRVRHADLRPSWAENQAIQNLGKLLVTRADEMQQERDAAVVGDAYNTWRDAERKALEEISRNKGKDAVNLGFKYEDFYNKSHGELDKNLENGTQQKALAGMMDRRRQQSLDSVASYEAQEQHRYRTEQVVGVIKNAEATVRSAGFNDTEVYDAKMEAFNFFDNANPGMSTAAKEAKYREIESQLTFANMQSRIKIDPDKALLSIEENKEVLGDGYDTLKKTATSESRDKLIEGLRDQLNFKHTKGIEPDFNAMQDEIQKSESIDDGIKDQVVGWIGAQESEYNQRVKKQRADTQDAEMDMIFESIRGGKFTDAYQATMKATQLTETQKYRIEKVIASEQGDKGETDKTAYNEFVKSVLRGEKSREDVINKIGVDFSIDDSKYLLGVIKQLEAPGAKQEAKDIARAVEAIEKQVLKGSQLVGYDPGSVDDAYNAVKQFEHEMANLPEGVTYKDAIDPESPHYIVDKIVKKNIATVTEQFQRQVEPYKLGNKNSRKKGETIEEYDARTGGIQ